MKTCRSLGARITWDPKQYLKFDELRDRPFFELIDRAARMRASRNAPTAKLAVDLGCGTGHQTATLLDLLGAKRVVGIDSSAEMLDKCEKVATAHNGLSFAPGDITSWDPEDTRVDVLVSNAALQWIPDHWELFPRWLESLAPGGTFAFQVPGNFDAPSHELLAQLRQSDRWRHLVGGVGADRHLAVWSPENYADYLLQLNSVQLQVDAWSTTYTQVLQGENPVLEWVRGTGLRPVLSKLSKEDASEFCETYAKMLKNAYAPKPFGTLFPFKRVFVVAQKI